jgi:site-specific DNA-cytosine methylase
MAGKRDKNDPRGKLFEQYIQLVEQLNPKICIIENVKGILSMKHYKDNITPNEKKLITKYEDSKCKDSLFQKQIKEMYNKKNLTLKEKNLIKKYEDWKNLEKQIIPYYEKVIDKIMKQFKKLGYKIEYKVLDSSLFGVPQKRERVIFIASRFDYDIVFPMPTNTIENMKTVKEAIDDLKNMDENNKWSHIFSNHCDDVIKKIQNTKIGESMNKKYNDAFFKCDPNKPSRTVKENHGGVFLHYEKNRVMTPRELARLQSFNDDFLFYGTKSSILKQIGNAVPPKLSEHLAQIILQMFTLH